MMINTIQHGDCLDLIKELPDSSIDCIITDPPYFLGVTHNGQKGTYSDLIIMKPFFESLFFQMERVLKKSGHLYVFCDWRTYPFLYPVAEQYISVKNLLVWYKGMSGGNQYGFSHEFIIFAAKGNVNMKGENTIRHLPGFAAGAKKTNGEKLHPTQKTVEIIEFLMLNSTKEGDVVLDCFLGSGTTAIAAIKNKRNYIGFELQDGYVKLSQDRIDKYAGEEKRIENYKQESNLFFNGSND
jgi:site-specific DNA-methyltransferase (adenine-specific)